MSHRYYGAKTNDDYPLMQECIDAYFAQGDFMSAILLHQKFASLMCKETVSFQERYGYSAKLFNQRQIEYFRRHFGDTRELNAST